MLLYLLIDYNIIFYYNFKICQILKVAGKTKLSILLFKKKEITKILLIMPLTSFVVHMSKDIETPAFLWIPIQNWIKHINSLTWQEKSKWKIWWWELMLHIDLAKKSGFKNMSLICYTGHILSLETAQLVYIIQCFWTLVKQWWTMNNKKNGFQK